MLTKWIKASGASFFLIVGTLAMFQPAGAHELVVAGQEAGQEIA